MMGASSGPSTSTAGPVPSPQLPQEAVDAAGQVVGPRVSAVGRTGGDGTLGQVGGLGTAGVTYGAVSTTEVADASGVHGDATAVTQGFSVATESGMASAQINVATGVSGYNPSAANPGSSAEGFETPRSTVYGASAVMQTGAQAFASHWLGRVQSLFGGAANVEPLPQAWAPSPLTSPPRPSRPLQPLERGGRSLQDEGQVPLFTGANVQQLAAMEQRAPLLYGSPDRHPHTESSSIQHDAIQAEVARQLEGLKQRLREEQEKTGRAEAELWRIQSQQAGGYEAPALQQVGAKEVSFSRFGDSGLGSRTVTTSGVALTPVPSSTPPPPPAAEPQGLTGLLLGLLGAGIRSSSSGHRSSSNEEEQDKLQYAAGTGRTLQPGAIPGRQDSLQALATVFQAALQVVQAAQHASHASGPQASRHSLQPSTQEEQPSSQPQLALSSAPIQDSTTVCPRFFKAFVRQLPCCQPVSCLMHQVRAQMMVQFRGSAATLRVGRVLKPFASATLLLQSR